MITATSKLVTEKYWQMVTVFWLELIIFITNILSPTSCHQHPGKNPNCRRITFRRNILCIFLCDWFVDIIICRKVCRSMLHRTHVVSALTVAVLLQLYNSASSPRTIPPFSELLMILLKSFLSKIPWKIVCHFETRKIHTLYSKLFWVKVQNFWFKKFQIKTISLVILTETLVDVLKTWNSRITIPESVNHSIWLKYLHFSRSQNINSFSNTSFNNNIRFWFGGFLFHTFHDLVELFIFKT